MEKINALLDRKPFFVVALLTFIACILGFARLAEALGTPILDSLASYDMAEVQARMIAYGEAGRLIYARAAVTLDLVFPLAYTALCAAILRFGFRDMGGPVAYVVLLPLLPALMDVAENLQIRSLLLDYPGITEQQVALSSLTTWSKWQAVRFVQLLIGVGLVRRLYLRLRPLAGG